MKKFFSIILPLFLLTFSFTQAKESQFNQTVVFGNNLLSFINEMSENFTPDEYQKVESIIKSITIEINNVPIPAGGEKRIPVQGRTYTVTLKTQKNLNYYLNQVNEIEIGKLKQFLSYFVKGTCSFSYNLYPYEEESKYVTLAEPIIDAYDHISELYREAPSKLPYRVRGLGVELLLQDPLND